MLLLQGREMAMYVRMCLQEDIHVAFCEAPRHAAMCVIW